MRFCKIKKVDEIYGGSRMIYFDFRGRFVADLIEKYVFFALLMFFALQK